MKNHNTSSYPLDEILELIEIVRATVDYGLRVWSSSAKARYESEVARCEPTQTISQSNAQSLMTIKDIAAYLSVSERSIKYWMDNNQFPSRYVGSALRFDLTEVNEWTKRYRRHSRPTMPASAKVRPLQTRLQANEEQRKCQSTKETAKA